MNALRAGLRGIGELLITLGVVVLLFLAWQLWWTDVVAGRSQDQLTQQLERTFTAQQPTGSQPAAEDPKLRLTDGEAFALIRVPRFGKDYVRPIIQGVELDVLDRGVGHYPASADPGAIGNFAVAGHRVTYAKPFNQIAELRVGDPVVVETARAWFVYRVTGHAIVTPDHTEVVAPVPRHPGQKPTRRMMTMTACHPKFSAHQRYVVWSELDERVAKGPGVKKPDVLR
ncbi:class E sortase [Angustibacter peucedani]